MTQNRNAEQYLRLAAFVIGLALFFVWLGLFYHFDDSHQDMLRLNPDEVERMRHSDEKIQAILLDVSIPLIVLGLEAGIIWVVQWRQQLPSTRADKVFQAKPKKRREIAEVPQLITSDIDACLTPPARETIALRNIQKLRQYCDFSKRDHQYPPFILVSARAQEYTELMCQTLGLINPERDIPCVLENGMALYWPHARLVKELVTDEMKKTMEAARSLLYEKLGKQYEFEPKQYMITINVERQRDDYGELLVKRKQAVQALRKLVERELSQPVDYLEQLKISSTSNAVDIVPKQVSKLNGLQAVLAHCNDVFKWEVTVEKVASIGNSEADEVLLEAAGKPFCAVREADSSLIGIVSKKSQANVFQEHDSAAVVAMIENVTGLALV